MKKSLLLMSLLWIGTLHAQRVLYFPDECLFFDYLKSMEKDPAVYKNELQKMEENKNQRFEVLLKLEEYYYVFNDYEISPMFLKSVKDSGACETFTKAYSDLVYKRFGSAKIDLSQENKMRREIQANYRQNILNLLFDLTGLSTEEGAKNVDMYLSEFRSSKILHYLHREYLERYIEPCRRQRDSIYYSVPMDCLSTYTYEQNLIKIENRIDELDKEHFVFYESYYSSPNVLKGMEAHHGNDFLLLLPGINQDREMTGEFRISFMTDYFKWRFFTFKKGPEKVLTYQAISVGGVGYTPYIRYRNNFELADTMHTFDRPFGSYYYLERAKYRTWRSGLIRQRGEFQFGMIGLSQGKKIQAKLHEDVIYDSQFVHGWEKQIGDGGRMALQANQMWSFLLYSKTNRYATIFRPNTIKVDKPKNYFGLNVIGEVDLRFGGFYTAAGIGLRLSSMDFLSQSGTHQIKSKPNCSRGFGIKIDGGISYRYVQHNTMLQGLGYWNTFPFDAYDKVNPDFYVLSKDRVERNLIIVDFGFDLRFRKTTLYFRQVFQTLEYKSGLTGFDYDNAGIKNTILTDDIGFYNDKVVKENKSFIDSKWFGGKTFYGYGTVGLSWIIE